MQIRTSSALGWHKKRFVLIWKPFDKVWIVQVDQFLARLLVLTPKNPDGEKAGKLIMRSKIGNRKQEKNLSCANKKKIRSRH